jgi:hypothetical protein
LKLKSTSKRIFVESPDQTGGSNLLKYYFILFIMKSAPVQNSSSLASHTCALAILFSLLLSMFPYADTFAQDSLPKTDVKKNGRIALITAFNVAGYGTSILIFNNQWYKNYPRTSFHTFNDSREWLQMDKLGHVWASYNSGRASAAMWRWAGLSEKKATWIGGLSSTVYLTVIEFLDAHSSKWGWSWADIGANFLGSGLFISQQLGWQEQRFQFKFSFHHKNYSDPILKARADDLYGSSWTERMLKDYNGQTYWLSANLKSFFRQSNLPAWLNVAIGYGAEGMFGGFENKWTDGDPGFPIDRTDIRRYRQWYLAPDIDFSKIKTNSKALRVLFAALDVFKFPAPGLELSNGKLKVNALHF